MSLFTQINSLCYWLNKNTKFISIIIFNGVEDSYTIVIKNNNEEVLFEKKIESFSVKGQERMNFEMGQIIQSLMMFKQKFENDKVAEKENKGIQKKS